MKIKRAAFFLVVTTLIGIAISCHLGVFSLSERKSSKIIINPSPIGYHIKTKMISYFALDSDGKLIPEVRNRKRYFKKHEKEYVLERTLFIDKSALIVMDPWLDNGDDDLNAYFKPLLSNKVIPLVSKALFLGIPIYILTNDPQKNHADYGSEIASELATLSDQGKINVLYHQDFDTQSFADFLHKRSIDTLKFILDLLQICVLLVAAWA